MHLAPEINVFRFVTDSLFIVQRRGGDCADLPLTVRLPVGGYAGSLQIAVAVAKSQRVFVVGNTAGFKKGAQLPLAIEGIAQFGAGEPAFITRCFTLREGADAVGSAQADFFR